MILPAVVHWDASPFIVTIGDFGLRWYSVLFVVGFSFGYYLFMRFFKREGLPGDKLLDPLLYTLAIATIVGARLGHCLFYEPGDYLTSWEGFVRIFKPWEGGLASHGGAIALVLAMWWFAKRYGKQYGFNYWWIMDRLVIAVCFAGACIRFGNLFNSEIYGDVTTLPWGFVFEHEAELVKRGYDVVNPMMPKHPTQLYEAFSYIILGVGLLWLYWKKLDKLREGTIFGIFMICLFGVRFLIEFIKEPQVDFEKTMALDMGQLLSIPFIIAGIAVWIWSVKKGGPARAQVPTNVKKNSAAKASK